MKPSRRVWVQSSSRRKETERGKGAPSAPAHPPSRNPLLQLLLWPLSLCQRLKSQVQSQVQSQVMPLLRSPRGGGVLRALLVSLVLALLVASSRSLSAPRAGQTLRRVRQLAPQAQAQAKVGSSGAVHLASSHPDKERTPPLDQSRLWKQGSPGKSRNDSSTPSPGSSRNKGASGTVTLGGVSDRVKVQRNSKQEQRPAGTSESSGSSRGTGLGLLESIRSVLSNASTAAATAGPDGATPAPARRHLQGGDASVLGETLKSVDLEELDLSLYSQPGDLGPGDKKIPVLGCRGSPCPSLAACGGSGISACHIDAFEDPPPSVPELPPASLACPQVGDLSAGNFFPGECQLAAGDWPMAQWAGQVVKLRNVFLDHQGQVFNGSHIFYPGGCIQDVLIHPKFAYGPDTPLVEIPRVVNLAMGAHGEHRLFEALERLPLVALVSAILPSLGVGTQFFFGPSKVMGSVLETILGVVPHKRALHLPKGSIFFVKTLYQPIHQACNVPSPSLWAYLRGTYLLPPRGLPMLQQQSWYLRKSLPRTPPTLPPLAPLDDDWAVLLALPPASLPLAVSAEFGGYYQSAPSVESLMQANFWFRHVDFFKWASKPAAANDLFRKTVLLITTPGTALAHMAFLPPGAVVVLLESAHGARARGFLVTHSGMSAQLRAFGRAAGLHVATLTCNQDPGEKGGLMCGRTKMMEALSWAAEKVFTSDLLPRAAERRRLPRRIPGSGLQTPEEVEAFRSWARCVSEKGQWGYDATPRPLPWPFHGSLERCDNNHINDAAGGLAGRFADDVAADPQASPASWRVREGLKYRWSASLAQCPEGREASGKEPVWERFSKEEFCSLNGGKLKILMLGDSIQTQLAEAIAQSVLTGLTKPVGKDIFSFEITKACSDWLKTATVPHTYCITGTFNADLCPGLEIELIRNDLLDIFPAGEPVFDRMPWAQVLKHRLDSADVIIFNRGPHYTPLDQFERGLQSTSRLLRMMYPNKLLIYRNTPPGHNNCTIYKAPLKGRQDPANLPYNWGKFREQNERARGIVEALGIVYMDVDTMTALRADGHKGFWPELNLMDCLHYCHPGPIDSWVELLYNILKKLKLRRRPSSQSD